MIITWLVNGAIGGAVVSLVALVLSRFTRDLVGRTWLAVALVGAAYPYIEFAARGHAGLGWIVAESVGVALFGGLAVLGILRSPWWLAAGWALHPLWDMLLHHVGAGRTFTPEVYPVSCVSWDLLIAVYIAVAYGFGLLGFGTGRPRAVQGAGT
jgi:hypothetical protein